MNDQVWLNSGPGLVTGKVKRYWGMAEKILD